MKHFLAAFNFANHERKMPTAPRSRRRSEYVSWFLISGAWLALNAESATVTIRGDEARSRIIIKYRASEPLSRQSHGSTDRLTKLSRATGESLVAIRSDVDAREDLIAVRGDHDARSLQALAEQLQSDPAVEYAVVDHRRRAHADPNDALYPEQWHLQSIQPSAIAAQRAWDVTQGAGTIVVAVLDTGVTFDHPDLAGKLLPGFDFVSGDVGGGFAVANDGNGRDADPSDPGDWIDSGDLQNPRFEDCGLTNSSWHGTRVAGLIGAATQNGIGVAGAGWNTAILPVRVLGKCGGFDSDILPAMRWAAGIHVDGVPDNPYPAKVLNLSLGGGDLCNALYQTTIQELNDRGVVVVVSAGNEGGPVSAPANCPGAVAVAGLRHAGTKVGYSNLGPQVSLAAPAGNCPPIPNDPTACVFSLTTTINAGTTQPITAAMGGATYTGLTLANRNIGTSFASPSAASVVALMISVNDQLSSAQLRARLTEGTQPFPRGDPGVPICHVPTGPTDIQGLECECTTSTCGAGMLNAEGAVRAALRPIAKISSPNIVAGATVTFDGASSTASLGRSIASYLWSVTISCDGSAPSLTVPNQSSLLVNAPTVGGFGLQLTVTDNVGATDSTYVFVSTGSASASNSAPTCPAPPVSQPQASGDESGGGGSLDFNWLIAMAMLRFLRRRYSGKSRVN